MVMCHKMTLGTRLMAIFTIKTENIGERVDLRKFIRKQCGYVDVLIESLHGIITVDRFLYVSDIVEKYGLKNRDAAVIITSRWHVTNGGSSEKMVEDGAFNKK